jgi:hypothetical protein
MSSHELPPLPEALEKDMQSLRNVEPSAALVERAMAGLPDGSSRPSSRMSDVSKRKNRPARRSMLVFTIPAVAIAVGAILSAFGKFDTTSREDMIRVEEKTLALPETGHAWTALDLQTHHHANEPALVHLEVPTNVRVRLPAPNGHDGDLDEQHCSESRCVHRFTQHHGKGVPVRIAVTHPGRYDIHVRHESKVAAMREHFVVNAKRD